MQVRIYHNTAEDAFGRSTATVDGYRAGDELVEVFSYEIPGRVAADPVGIAERAYFLFNVGEDPDFGPPQQLAIDYRALELRSLSVGDVVGMGEAFYACGRSGWELADVRASQVAEKATR